MISTGWTKWMLLKLKANIFIMPLFINCLYVLLKDNAKMTLFELWISLFSIMVYYVLQPQNKFMEHFLRHCWSPKGWRKFLRIQSSSLYPAFPHSKRNGWEMEHKLLKEWPSSPGEEVRGWYSLICKRMIFSLARILLRKVSRLPMTLWWLQFCGIQEETTILTNRPE